MLGLDRSRQYAQGDARLTLRRFCESSCQHSKVVMLPDGVIWFQADI